MSVRRVAEVDVPAVVSLVHELADYEEAAHECFLTEADLHRTLFAETPALFGHVAETDDEVVGFALWFLNFSTWRGTHGIYLEDLFVRPQHRGGGHGKALFRALAVECVQRGYARFEWSVLNWNTPAIAFYEATGAVAMDGWTGYRLTGDALAALGCSPEDTPHSPQA